MGIGGATGGGGILDAMGEVRYRWLWGTALASNSARYAVVLVAGWLAFELTRSPIGPGLVSFLAFVPALLFGPVAGALADRIDRRSLIRAGMVIGGGMCALTAVLAEMRDLTLTVVLLLAGAVGVALAFEQPSRVSLVPIVVRPRQLLNAFSLMRIPTQGSEFVGPALTTGLLARSGPIPALWLCGLLYAIAAALVTYVTPPPSQAPRERAGLWDEIRTGLAYLGRERMIGVLILFVGAHCAFTMAFMGILPSLAATALRGDSTTYGLLMTAVGLGATAGPLALAGWAHRANERRLLVVTAFLSGVTLTALGLSRTAPAAVVMAAATGAAQSLFMVLIYTQTQALAADPMRGRVASFAFFFTGGVMGGFNLLLSAAAERLGAQAVLVGCGLVFVAATCVFLVRVPQLRWSPPPLPAGGRAAP